MFLPIRFDEHDVLAEALHKYEPTLIRSVAQRLLKPRGHWPVEDLIDRILDSLNKPEIIERRLEELSDEARQLLTLIARSRQPLWRLGNLIELCLIVGQSDGLKPVVELLEMGMLFPYSSPMTFANFEQWLTLSTSAPWLLAHPLSIAASLRQSLTLPNVPRRTSSVQTSHPADGLEWPLRLAATRQTVHDSPLRLTQQGEFFKRDQQRLEEDTLLNALPADGSTNVPGSGFLAVCLAGSLGIIQDDEDELHAQVLPETEERGLPETLCELWQALLVVHHWRPDQPWQKEQEIANPYPSAYVAILLMLSELPEEEWLSVDAIAKWIVKRHPYWPSPDEESEEDTSTEWLSVFLLQLAPQLRLVNSSKNERNEDIVQLSDVGRWLFHATDEPPEFSTFPQALMVQPNLEIVAYRQGLTPTLIQRLTNFATWKSLGVACALQLDPDRTYHALELGESLESISEVLVQHGAIDLPDAVRDSLKTWARKRDRLRVYPSATLFEFHSAEELEDALSRGMKGQRLSDTLLLIANENDIDYSHFRINSTRDYSSKPEECVTVEDDGITVIVDLKKSDLLVESEISRFARLLREPIRDQRRYRMTPSTLARAREQGMSVSQLEEWFQDRAGEPLSPAAYLLLTAAQSPPPTLQTHLVLQVANDEIADGLEQWPPTKALIVHRLGPCALSVLPEEAETLRDYLAQLGVEYQTEERQ